MSLRVLQIGADAAWREAPLTGWRKFGVPEGGPFDREAWAWCCALSGANRAVEIGPFGGLCRAEDRLSVAVTGALRPVLIGGTPQGNGCHTLEAGQSLQLGHPEFGARSYLSTCQEKAHSKGLVPDLVRRDDVLAGTVRQPVRLSSPTVGTDSIRVVAGPQSTLFDVDNFLEQEWTVGLAADRTGIRLDGPAMEANSAWGDRPSEPQVTGTIQITSGGTPIIIGPDGPTIGGYPKIAVVIDADRDRLGQVKPGDRVSFRLIGLDEASSLRREYHARLRLALAARF